MIPKLKTDIYETTTGRRSDSTLAEAFAARGRVLVYDWPYRWDAAERSLRRAIELDPRLALAHANFGDYLLNVGRLQESIAEHQRATELDEYSARALGLLGISQMAARQFDDAIASYRHALALDPGMDGLHEQLAMAFVLHGKPDAALRELAALSDSVGPTGAVAVREPPAGRDQRG